MLNQPRIDAVLVELVPGERERRREKETERKIHNLVNLLYRRATHVLHLLAGQYAYYISGLVGLNAYGTTIAVHVLLIGHLARLSWNFHNGLLCH